MVIDESLQGLVGVVSARLEDLEKQATAAIEAQLEMMERRLATAHDASMEAVGLLAGQVLFGVEEQVARIQAAVEARNEQLLNHVDTELARQHAELMEWVDFTLAGITEAVEAGGPTSGRTPDSPTTDEPADLASDGASPTEPA